MPSVAPQAISPLAATSVVVPVGPGEEAWRQLLNDLRAIDCGAEVLFAAVESPPGDWSTLVAEASCSIRWLQSAPGRAAQLNCGVEHARGEYLWFLHADSRVDRAALQAYAATIRNDPDALYYFDLAFADDGPPLTRLNAWGANLRSRWLGLPFGDQGFCVTRATCERLGPFDVAAPYGEDHLWVWKARRRGIAVRRVAAAVRTSGRKYARHGWLATTGLHVWRTVYQGGKEAANRLLRRPL